MNFPNTANAGGVLDNNTGKTLGLTGTVEWYLSHVEWWQRIKSGEYEKYYGLLYGNR